MDNKAVKNVLNQVLTFAVIFLAINFIFNTFFNKPVENKTGLIFVAEHQSYGQNDLVTARIENYTDKDITIKSTCPNAPLQVEKLTNGEWQAKTAIAKVNCQHYPDITIAVGQKHIFNFKSWNHDLFSELGNYKIKLDLDGKTLETNQFEVVPPSFFSWIWNTLIHQPIYNALIFFASITPTHDLGLAIILLTILIRTILLIPNQKALKSQKRLQQIQPKINALKEKHGADQQKIAQETFAIYKEHKVSPFGSCLPILIQLPILIGLFNVIQNGMDPGSQYLLYPPLKDFDLNSVQTIFLGILDLTKVDWIVLPILVGGLQFLQMKISMAKSKKAAQKPANEMEMATRTMTYTMPVMIAFFTASTPSGVGIYWAFSTLYGIIQQMVINKQSEKEQTTIQVADSKGSNKDKKKHYHELNQARKAEKKDDSNDNNDTDSQAGIRVIKA